MTGRAIEERWRELTAAALLGIERQAPPLEPTGTPLDGLLGRIDPADRAGALLDAAAAVALYRRAGQRPGRLEGDGVTAGEGAPPEERPTCSPRALVHLSLMLGGQHGAVLPEWLAALVAAGRRAPPRLLPDLLDLGWTRPDLRPAIVAAIGRRGEWLAAQNPIWSYALGDDVEPEAVWTTGERAARQSLLGRLRAREPARARALLESTWAEETPDDRASLLAQLQVGLGADDEPFLETALDDRRKEVRDRAADLLARLPDSRLVERMRARVRPLLTPTRERRLLGLGSERLRIGVALPGAPDRAATRDGLSGKRLAVPGGQLGDRASGLAEMLAAIPPATWSREWAAAPANLIAAAGESEHGRALLHGWRLAAERHRDAEWAEALLAVQEWGAAATEPLVALLPPARREALALAQLRGGGGILLGDDPTLAILRQCHHPWSAELARVVLERVRKAIPAGVLNGGDWQLRAALVGFARYVPPGLLAEASADWPDDAPTWPAWREPVEEFLTLLQFRQEMLEEIAR